MEPVAAALARLSKAQAKCAKELEALSESHADSPAWASAGIAAVVRLCHDPASAADAATTLGRLSGTDDANDDLIREAGAIQPLVAMLSGGIESEAARTAAGALSNLAVNSANKAAITEAGAIPPLVALLSGGPESEAATEAATRALANLTCSNEANRVAITEAGAIPLLVALLSGGPESRAAGSAAAALRKYLACIEASRAAITEAGAIPPLVALLSGGPESEAAREAAAALHNLACGTNTTAVLEEVASTQTDCSSWDDLRKQLRKCASAQLQAVEEGTDVAALERALTLAAAVQVDATVVERAQGRLREINGDAERQERRESFGLGSLELPDEFVCPITMDKMRGVPPPPSPPACIARAPPPRLPRLRRRPGGGVRRPLIRAVRHPLGAPRRQRLEPAHPRAAPAKRAHPEPQPEAAHAGARRGRTAYCGHRCSER